MYIRGLECNAISSIVAGVCDNPLGQMTQNILGQNATNTCNKINLNATYHKIYTILCYSNSVLWSTTYADRSDSKSTPQR